MTKGKYKQFSYRLIEAMKSNGHTDSRSPNGICMNTLAEFAGASVQICRRYIRGDALPDYDKVVSMATHLKISSSWLLFGEKDATKFTQIDADLMSYIVQRCSVLYFGESEKTDEFVQFLMKLIREVQKINGNRETLEHVINLALDSVTFFYASHEKKPSKRHECA